MDWSLLTSIPALAAYGGFVSALRAAIKDPNKGLPEKVLDVVVGVVMAVSVAEYYVPSAAPKMAMVVGLIAGSFGGYLMDACQALSPNLAAGILDGILGKFGYSHRPPDDDDEAA